jgi:chromosomal replication initiation ATPase DnaA
MTKKEFINELKAYFHEFEWRPFDENKVMNMLERFQRTVEPIVILKKVYLESNTSPTYANNQGMMEQIAKDVCAEHNITIEQLKANSNISCYRDGKRRGIEYVTARRDMCRRVKQSAGKDVTLVQLKDWFGYKDHSSIIHLLNSN